MDKLPFRILIIGLALLTTTYFFYSYSSKFNLSNLLVSFSKPKIDIKDDQNAFGSLVNQLDFQKRKTEGKINAQNKLFDKYGEGFKDIRDGREVFLLAIDTNKFDYLAPWDYTNTPFWAEIISVSEDTTSLTLKFISPNSMPFLNEEKTVISTKCVASNSFLETENPNTLETDIALFQKISSGDSIISFCLDTQCSNIGKLCKLYRD